jgi:hypothetical protein
MLEKLEEAAHVGHAAKVNGICYSISDASHVSDDSKADPAAIAPRSSLENWCRASKIVMPKVAVSRSFKTLRDMVGPEACVDPSCLTKIKQLGEGAFATVELCW